MAGFHSSTDSADVAQLVVLVIVAYLTLWQTGSCQPSASLQAWSGGNTSVYTVKLFLWDSIFSQTILSSKDWRLLT